METAIRWSPWSTLADQRFLYVDVAGKSFRLCQVTGHVDQRKLLYRTLATHTKVPVFRAFDWSPADEALIAVGQSSGEATLLRMHGDSQESFSFPVRNQRYCNAVAFSSHGLLAAGLDRVRNDFCLNIWDINQRIMLGTSRGFTEPLRKLANSEPITSIKFFREQPATLVTGVKGQFVRIYDLRGTSSPFAVKRIIILHTDFFSFKRHLGMRHFNFQPGVYTTSLSTRLMKTILLLACHQKTLPSVCGTGALDIS